MCTFCKLLFINKLITKFTKNYSYEQNIQGLDGERK